MGLTFYFQKTEPFVFAESLRVNVCRLSYQWNMVKIQVHWSNTFQSLISGDQIIVGGATGNSAMYCTVPQYCLHYKIL